MDEETYFKERLEDQINWYSNKSMHAQKKYKLLKGVEIALSASIPLVVGITSGFEKWTVIVSLIGVIITTIEGWLSIAKYHENWIEYRSICETLKHEKYMFLTKTGVYNTDNNFKYLVERVESIISKENINWANLNKKTIGGKVNG